MHIRVPQYGRACFPFSSLGERSLVYIYIDRRRVREWLDTHPPQLHNNNIRTMLPSRWLFCATPSPARRGFFGQLRGVLYGGSSSSSSFSFSSSLATSSPLAWKGKPPPPAIALHNSSFTRAASSDESVNMSNYSDPVIEQDAEEEAPEVQQSFVVEVFTGNRRLGGTNSRISVQLLGEKGNTPIVRLKTRNSLGQRNLSENKDWQRGGYEFGRDTATSFRLALTHDIGEVLQLWIGHDNSCYISDTGWYVEKVEVTCEDTATFYEFPVEDWLGGHEHASVDMLGNGYESKSRPIARYLTPGDGTMRIELIEPFEEAAMSATDIHVSTAAVCYPHTDKVRRGVKGYNTPTFGYGGEDAYIVRPSDPYVLGVADGVYAWREENIDAGLFSQGLLKEAMAAIEGSGAEMRATPGLALKQAYEELMRQKVLGSSVACLAVIDRVQDGDIEGKGARFRLNSANLGDSGYMILRRTKIKLNQLDVVFQTSPLEWTFGCPYQLGHHEGSCTPEQAQLYSQRVYPGDIIVMGSDGLFDNVSVEAVRRAIETLQNGGEHVQESTSGNAVYSIKTPVSARAIATALGNMAFAASVNKTSRTPYSVAASEEFNLIFQGGKKDDITVVCGIVEEKV